MRRSSKGTALVVGGGLVGATSALRLQQAGFDALLVDSAAPYCASDGNAGHIAVEQVEPLASWATLRTAHRRLFVRGGALDIGDAGAFLPWAARFVGAAAPRRFAAGAAALRALAFEAMPAWRRLVGDLGASDLLREDGHLLAWETGRSAAAGKAAWSRVDVGPARVGALDEPTLSRLSALTAGRPVAGLRFEGSGQVNDLSALRQSIAETLMRAGGRIETAHVAALAAEGGVVHAVLADGRRIDADLVLVAGGVGSAKLMAGVGPRPPLIAERGYHLHWREHDWPADLPPVVFEDRSMIVTRFADGLRAASFVEFGRADQPADPRKWDRLRAHVHELGLPVRGEAARWMGARPTLPDYLPAIGRFSAADNLVYAFGHQHLGLTLAPVTAELVAALAIGQAPAISLQPFDLARFSGGSGVRRA